MFNYSTALSFPSSDLSDYYGMLHVGVNNNFAALYTVVYLAMGVL